MRTLTSEVMEIRVTVHKGEIRLPSSVDVPDGTEVCVVVDDELLARQRAKHEPLEKEPLEESDVMDDLRWTTGLRFP